MDNPKIQLQNFSGMDEKGTYYLEGFSAKLINGQSILSPTWRATEYIDNNNTGFSDLVSLRGIDQIDFSTNIQEKNNLIGIDTAGNIYAWHNLISSYHRGKIHDIGTTITTKSDIKVTDNNNIIYTSAQYLGWAKSSTLTGGSTTTAVVDGYDFSSAGFNIGDKMYNLTKKEEYTITGFATTGGTSNDTLQFSAGTACASGDTILTFDDNKWDLGTEDTSINRQIAKYDNEYYITNDNYLASLDIDETSLTKEDKQLISGVEATIISTNKDQILVAGTYKNKGTLLLWDGYTDGWQSQINVDKPVQAIKPYGSTWIFIEGIKLFQTNGVGRPQEITTFPSVDNINTNLSVSYNGMEIVDDKIIINYDIGDYTNAKSGYGIYDLKYGWTVIPSYNGNGYNYTNNGGVVFQHRSDNNRTEIFADWKDMYSTDNYGINKILNSGANKATVMFAIRLPRMINIEGIGLNISPKYNQYLDNNGTDTEISVSYGEGKGTLWGIETSGASGTTTTIPNPNGSIRSANVGEEILVLEGNSGGDMTYITEIADGGTANEVWTVSPALSSAISENALVNRINLRKAKGQSTVNSEDITKNKEIQYNFKEFYSDKLFLQITFDTTDNYLDIWQINIY